MKLGFKTIFTTTQFEIRLEIFHWIFKMCAQTYPKLYLYIFFTFLGDIALVKAKRQGGGVRELNDLGPLNAFVTNSGKISQQEKFIFFHLGCHGQYKIHTDTQNAKLNGFNMNSTLLAF